MGPKKPQSNHAGRQARRQTGSRNRGEGRTLLQNHQQWGTSQPLSCLYEGGTTRGLLGGRHCSEMLAHGDEGGPLHLQLLEDIGMRHCPRTGLLSKT